MPKQSNTALVLGSDGRATLSVIRSLGRKGINVHLGWCSENSIASKSKYVRQQLKLPSYSKSNQVWLNTLNNKVEREKYDIIIPCSDPTIIPLQLNRKNLVNAERFYLVEPMAFQICQDKIRSVAMANELNIPCPVSITIPSTEELDLLLQIDKFPVIIKPQESFSAEHSHQKAFVQPANDSNEAISITTRLLSRGPVQIQEHVDGVGIGVEVLCKNGDVLFAFQHQRIHQPKNGGGSSYRKSVPLVSPLLDAASKLMKALNYTGVAMVEFIWNDRTNSWYFVEINARFWGSLPLAIAAKADFPFFLYEMLVRGRTGFEQKYKTNVFCRNIRSDFHWFAEKFKSSHDPVANQKHLISNVFVGIKNFVLLRERFDTLTLDDMAPGIDVLKTLFRFVLAKRFLKAFPNRRNFVGGKPTKTITRILSKIRTEGKVTFVCKGNICRSPFAELTARQVLANTAVESSGYFPKSNRSCPKTAIESATSFGIDMSKHRSRRLTKDVVQHAGVILVFDAENYLHMVENYNFARNRLFLLGEFFESSPKLINDPYSKDHSQFDSTYSKIKSCIQTLSDLLKRKP